MPAVCEAKRPRPLQVRKALDAMRELIEGRRPADGHLAIMHAAVGALMAELDRFTVCFTL